MSFASFDEWISQLTPAINWWWRDGKLYSAEQMRQAFEVGQSDGRRALIGDYLKMNPPAPTRMDVWDRELKRRDQTGP